MYTKLCDVSLLNVDEPRLFRVNNAEIMVILHDENYYWLAGRCTHAGAPISEGTLNGQVLTCPWHYSQFNITTGEVLHGPAGEPLKLYKSEAKDCALYVDLACV